MLRCLRVPTDSRRVSTCPRHRLVYKVVECQLSQATELAWFRTWQFKRTHLIKSDFCKWCSFPAQSAGSNSVNKQFIIWCWLNGAMEKDEDNTYPGQSASSIVKSWISMNGSPKLRWRILNKQYTSQHPQSLYASLSWMKRDALLCPPVRSRYLHWGMGVKKKLMFT